MNKRWVCLALVGVLGGALSGAQAEPRPPSADFFPRNYVNEGLPRDTPRPATTIRPPHRETPGVQAHDSLVHGGVGSQPRQLQNSAEGMPAVDSPDFTFAVVYVNSKDREHFNRALKTVLRISESRKALVGAVLHVGDYTNVTTEHKRALEKAGIALEALHELPLEMEGLMSPIWQVYSKGRPIHVSGIFDISRFYGPTGGFKLPAEGDQALSVPRQELDGF